MSDVAELDFPEFSGSFVVVRVANTTPGRLFELGASALAVMSDLRERYPDARFVTAPFDRTIFAVVYLGNRAHTVLRRGQPMRRLRELLEADDGLR